jgi:hypothetical protein
LFAVDASGYNEACGYRPFLQKQSWRLLSMRRRDVSALFMAWGMDTSNMCRKRLYKMFELEDEIRKDSREFLTEPTK